MCDPGSVDSSAPDVLEQWFSAFQMLLSFSTVPYGMMTPNHKIISIATL